MSLETINLIVGRNASGKSRTITVIWSLAARLSGMMKDPMSAGNIRLALNSGDKLIEYKLEIVDSKIVYEAFVVNGTTKLERHKGGSGEIYAEQEKKHLKFQAPENQLAVVVRQDSIQHSFLEDLINWSKGVYYLPFGTPLGREHYAMFQDGAPDANTRDANQVTGILRNALRDHGDNFKNRVLQDMARIGYDLEDVGITQSNAVQIMPMNLKASCLYVKEADLPAQIEQMTISQGMFRALSTIIQVNYGIIEGGGHLILIDDIGEGLDYSRSCELIGLLIERIEGTSLQLVASTNDRFVMNGVNIKYWTILDRQSNIVKPLNYRNSKEIFDEFKFTGLSNFDFLSRDFFRGQ